MRCFAHHTQILEADELDEGKRNGFRHRNAETSVETPVFPVAKPHKSVHRDVGAVPRCMSQRAF